MTGLRVPIVTPDAMYECDHAMIENYGIPSSVLMENAASSVFAFLNQEFHELQKEKILVIAGPGKNGEDGLVLARQLTLASVSVTILVFPPAGELTSEYCIKLSTLISLGVTIVEEIPDFSVYSLIIDALFGIGLSRPPAGVYRDTIERINSSKAIVISLDIPSGIASENGCELGVAVFCDYCISFGAIKIGNLLYDGYAHCKNLIVSMLHAPYLQYLLTSGTRLLLNVPASLPVRDKCGYKNSFGSCLVIGGSKNYHGAPYFSASAFMKSGGGYVHLVSIKEVAQSVGVLLPECVFHPFSATEQGSLPPSAFETIEIIGVQQNLVILGPGLGVNEDTESLLKQFLQSKQLSDTLLLIDGDALSLLGKNVMLVANRKPYTTILTPHLGEMSRLTGYSVDEIAKNSIEVAEEFSQKWQVLLLLKGPRSVIVTQNHTYINTTGTEALGTAGSGDVLDGIIGAFCSSPLGIIDGLRNGVFLHGFIGNLLSDHGDTRSISATDIIQNIPMAIDEFSARFGSLKEKQTPFELPGICFMD